MKVLPRLLSGGLVTLSLLVNAASRPHFVSDDLLQWHVAPEQAAELTLRLKEGTAPRKLQGSLLDYSGRKWRSVELERKGDGKFYRTTVKLPRGFHELEIPASKQRFGIVALEPFQGAADPFFRIQADLYSANEAVQTAGYQVLYRAGIREVREFHGWDREEPSEGCWDPLYERIYGTAKKTGIKILSYLSYPPEWAGGQPDKNKANWQPYPLDLLKMRKSLQTRFQRRSALMDGFQVDNEPDLKAVPGNEYAPMAAAVSFYMAENGVAAPLVGGAIADTRNWAELMLKDLADNGFLDCIDVFALHNYLAPEMMENRIRAYRDLMRSSAKSGLPIWITECGKPWARGIREKAKWGGPAGNLRAQVEEDKVSACWIVMKGIESKACGAASYYPYRCFFRPERMLNFGMCDFYRTPMRQLAAYFFSVRALANKRYAGDLKVPGAYVRKRLFADDKEAVAVLYGGKEKRMRSYDLTGLPVYAVCGADGRTLKPGPDGTYCIDDGLIYVFLKKDGKLNALAETETEAGKLLRLAESYRTVLRKVPPVVYRSDLYAESRKNELAYLFFPDRIGVDIFNLSDREQVTEPELILPEGVVSDGAAVRKTVLPPRSRVHVEWAIDTRNSVPRFQVKVRDRSGAAVPLALNFIGIREENGKSFELGRASRWKNNCAGKMTISQDPAENAVRVHSDFSNVSGDWSYPEYILNMPEESLENAYAVSFEIKAEQPGGITYYPYSYVQIVDGMANRFRQLPMDPPTSGWSKRTVPLPAGTLKNVRKFRIGMGSREKEFVFWIRNVKFYFLK